MNLTGFSSVLFLFYFIFFASHILEGSVQQPLLQPGSPYYMFFFFLRSFCLAGFGSFQCAYVDLPHTFSFILLWWSPHLSFHDFLFLFFTGESDVRTFFFPVIIFVFKFFYYALVMQLLRSYTHRIRGNLQRCRTGKAMV